MHLCVCVFLHDNSKSNRSMNMKGYSSFVCLFVCMCVCVKFKHIVEYENKSDNFDIGHCWTKVKVIP